MKKVLFLSKEWIDIADSVLREIVSEHGEEGKNLVFQNLWQMLLQK